MPIPIPEKELRGIFVKLVRGGDASPSTWSINNALKQAPYTGKYNPVRGDDIKKIESSLKKGPFPTTGLVEFSFGYWFNYFFKELPDTDKIRYAAYVVNDDGSFRNEQSVVEKPWKDIFNEMLNKGFKAFEAKDHLTANEVMTHASAVAKNELQQKQVQVAFRGDGRTPSTIQQQKGTSRQSKVEVLRQERNMTKPWHPYNDKGHKVWVRKGFNADNCLFSTVSITPQFGVATKFPLLDDLRGSNPGAIGHSIVRVRPRNPSAPVAPQGSAVSQKYLAATRQSDSDTYMTSLLASQTNIYCVRLRDVYNTQNYQQGSIFPEYAVTRISWTDHLLWFGVTRIHFDELNGNAGHLIVITGHKWLQDSTLISNVLLNTAALGHLQQFTNDIVSRGSLINGVGGIVYTPPGVEAPFDIVSVKELFIPGRPTIKPPTDKAFVRPQAPKPNKLTIPDAFNKGF